MATNDKPQFFESLAEDPIGFGENAVKDAVESVSGLISLFPAAGDWLLDLALPAEGDDYFKTIMRPLDAGVMAGYHIADEISEKGLGRYFYEHPMDLGAAVGGGLRFAGKAAGTAATRGAARAAGVAATEAGVAEAAAASRLGRASGALTKAGDAALLATDPIGMGIGTAKWATSKLPETARVFGRDVPLRGVFKSPSTLAKEIKFADESTLGERVDAGRAGMMQEVRALQETVDALDPAAADRVTSALEGEAATVLPKALAEAEEKLVQRVFDDPSLDKLPDMQDVFDAYDANTDVSRRWAAKQLENLPEPLRKDIEAHAAERLTFAEASRMQPRVEIDDAATAGADRAAQFQADLQARRQAAVDAVAAKTGVKDAQRFVDDAMRRHAMTLEEARSFGSRLRHVRDKPTRRMIEELIRDAADLEKLTGERAAPFQARRASRLADDSPNVSNAVTNVVEEVPWTFRGRVANYVDGKRFGSIPVEDVALAMLRKRALALAPDRLKAIGELRKRLDAARTAGNAAERARVQKMLKSVSQGAAGDAYLDFVGRTVGAGDLGNARTYTVRRMLDDALSEAAVITELDPVLKGTDAVRNLWFRLGHQAHEVGLLPEESLLHNLATYHPDFYKKYEAPLGGVTDKRAARKRAQELLENPGLILDRFKSADFRSSSTHQRRKREGLVTDAKYHSLKGGFQVIHDIQWSRMMNELADSPNIVSYQQRNGTVPVRRTPRNRRLFDRMAENKRAEMAAAGEDISRFRAPDVAYMSGDAATYFRMMESADSTVIKVWNKFLSAWKFTKTVLNPATHIRNAISNVIFAQMHGMLPGQWKDSRYALRDARRSAYNGLLKGKKDALYREAEEAGTFKGQFLNEDRNGWQDLMDVRHDPVLSDNPFELAFEFANMTLNTIPIERVKKMTLESGGALAKAESATARFNAAAANTYALGDNVFRLWRFKQLRMMQAEFVKTNKLTSEMLRAFEGDAQKAADVLRSGTREEMLLRAGTNAREAFLDYADVPQFVTWTRKVGAPFITFHAKALPMLSESFRRDPLKWAVWRHMFDYANYWGEAAADHDADPDGAYRREMDRLGLPVWAQAGAMRLGAGERFGSPTTESVDLQYFTPMGGLVQSGESFETSLVPEFLKSTNPVVGMVGALMFNRDPQSPDAGDLIPYGAGVGPGEVIGAIAGQAWRDLAPPLLGTNARRIYNAARNTEADIAANPALQTVEEAILKSVLGLSTYSQATGSGPGRFGLRFKAGVRKNREEARRRAFRPDKWGPPAESQEVMNEYLMLLAEKYQRAVRDAQASARVRQRVVEER